MTTTNVVGAMLSEADGTILVLGITFTVLAVLFGLLLFGAWKLARWHEARPRPLFDLLVIIIVLMLCIYNAVGGRMFGQSDQTPTTAVKTVQTQQPHK